MSGGCPTRVMRRLELCRRNVAPLLEQAATVELVDPFESRKLDRLDALPRALCTDDLGLEQADD